MRVYNDMIRVIVGYDLKMHVLILVYQYDDPIFTTNGNIKFNQ